jgi:hypothetical protein
MAMILGRFGDRRLEKGGSIFWAAWLKLAAVVSVFGGWAVIALVRFA